MTDKQIFDAIVNITLHYDKICKELTAVYDGIVHTADDIHGEDINYILLELDRTYDKIYDTLTTLMKGDDSE